MSADVSIAKQLEEKVIIPFWNYRNGGQNKAGTIIYFSQFMKERPDGGENPKIKNSDGSFRVIDSWKEIYKAAKINPLGLVLNDLAGRSDSFRLLFGPQIEDIFLDGFLRKGSGKPAVWVVLCAETGVPHASDSLRKAAMWFDGEPAPTGEFGDFPICRIGHTKEDIFWMKEGMTIEFSREFLMAHPIAVASYWIKFAARKYQYRQNLKCVNTIRNGDLKSQKNSCPVIGVATPLSGNDYGINYDDDILEVWTKGDLMGIEYSTFLCGQKMAKKIAAMDEFKEYIQGEPRVKERNAPDLSEVQRFTITGVPDNRVTFLDTAECVRHRVWIPPTMDKADRPENWSERVVMGWSDTFELLEEKARIEVDETLDFENYGWPEYYTEFGSRYQSEEEAA